MPLLCVLARRTQETYSSPEFLGLVSPHGPNPHGSCTHAEAQSDKPQSNLAADSDSIQPDAMLSEESVARVLYKKDKKRSQYDTTYKPDEYDTREKYDQYDSSTRDQHQDNYRSKAPNKYDTTAPDADQDYYRSDGPVGHYGSSYSKPQGAVWDQVRCHVGRMVLIGLLETRVGGVW